MLLSIILMLPFTYVITADKDYAIQFDAGSSGTRMFIYEYDSDFINTLNSNVTVSQIASCKTREIGISKIKTHNDVIRSFSRCIKMAHNLIPKSKWNNTLITLKATAGMRLLELYSPLISKNVYHLIREYFNQTGFLFEEETQVKTISGKDEALNAWITANFLDKNFHKNGTEFGTRGILDLGGASTQISFVPINRTNENNLEVINLFGVNYTSYSQSFLCFGVDQANLVYKTNLLKKSNYSDSITAACFPKNYQQNFKTYDIAISPCGSGSILNETLMLQDYNLTLNGDSDYEQCRQEIKELFKNKKECQTGQDACSFKSVKFPNTQGVDFYGISVFYYTIRASNILFNTSFNNDLEGFKNATKILCSSSYEELIERNEFYKSDLKEWLGNLCFQNLYITELLARFGIKSFENIKFVEKINGHDVGWNLGYLINELNHL